MEYVKIGPVNVSRMGFGTGSSGFSGVCKQKELGVKELADLLCHAFDKGVNFFDTGHSYGTYPHLSLALKHLPRGKVVISTKFSDSFEGDINKKITETLKALDTDYLDICLMHGVRNSFELSMRSGALKALIKAKEKGYIRCVGLSSHGIGAIESASIIDAIEVIFARLNWSGASMDGYQEGILSRAVAIPYVKEIARRTIPKSLVPSFSARVESLHSDRSEQERVKDLLSRCAAPGKSIVAMKVYGAGALTGELKRSLEFIMSQDYIKAFLLGMASRKEFDENMRIYREILSLKASTTRPTPRERDNKAPF